MVLGMLEGKGNRFWRRGLQFCATTMLAFGCSARDSAPAGPLDAGATKPAERCLAQTCLEGFPFSETTQAVGALRTYGFDVTKEGLFGVEASEGFDVKVARLADFSDCIRCGSRRAAVWLSKGRYYVAIRGAASSQAALEVKLSLTSNVATMSDAVAKAGLQAFSVAFAKGDTEKLIYAMTDYSLPSSERRQWIVDLRTSEVLWNLYVAHGEKTSKGTDPNISEAFSNVNGSHQSSLGMMRSAETYTGDYGYSYRLDGLEAGYNDLVRPRDIVVHPWFGSTPAYVAKNRMAAPTWGCPAVDQGLPKDFFDTMSNGVLHWYSFPDGDWSQGSTYRM